MALKKTFENKDGGTSNGYYRVREVGTHYEKDKDEPTSLAASFVVELYDVMIWQIHLSLLVVSTPL